MMKQLLLNQRKTGGRVTSLLVVLLTTLAMTLLPQRACADVTVGFTGYGNDVITGNPCNWNVVGGSNISFTADEGLGASVPVTGTTAFMVTSAFSFSGEVNSISLEMEYSEGLTIKAYYVEASGNSTNLSANNSFDYANGMYTLTLSNVASLKEHSIQLQFTTNSDNCQISKWKGITVGGNVSLNVPVTYYGITVAGVQVTSENIQQFKGVSFSDGILSLEDANLTGGLEVDWSTFANSGFKINITGENTIAAATEGSAISSNSESATIALTFSGTGKLTLTNDGTNPLTSGFDISFQDNLGTSASLTSGEIETATISTMYNLFVAGTRVSEANKGDVLGDVLGDDNATVSYDPENSILTLDAVQLPMGIQTSMENLTIKVRGTNTVYSEDGNLAPIAYSGQNNVGGTLTIIKDDTYADGICSLNLISYAEVSAITGFSNVEYGDGMSLAAAYGTEYSTTGKYYYNSSLEGAAAVPYVSKVTITSATLYPLWFSTWDGQVQVTSENADDITGSENESGDPCLSYDVETNTLVFNDFSNEINGNAVSSNLSALNVSLVGNSTMLLGEEYTGFTSYNEDAVLTFKTSDDSPGSLSVMATTLASGFSDIQYQNDLVSTMDADGYGFNISVPPYGLIVYTEGTEGEPNGVQVTKKNRADVLGDGGTVQFNGNSRLVLNGAQLTKIETGLERGAELELYLNGANIISGSTSAIIDTNQGMPKLVIVTDGNNPGSLTLDATGGVIQGFQPVEIKQPLAIMSPEGATSLIGNAATITSAYVGAPLGLIVDGVSSTPQTTETAINYSDISGANEPVAASALTNLVINNVLYTLNDDGTVGSPDGYDGSRDQIVLNSTMTDDDVSDINVRVEGGTLVPGTKDYADRFKGLTFMVPADMGTITLNTKTDLAHEFHLKVGGQDPITVINYTDNNDVGWVVDYTVSKSTYVYLYLVKKSSATAPGYGGHRAGPKATISGGIGGMKVESSSIAVVPEPSTPYLQMTTSDYTTAADGSKYGIKVTNTAVTDLPDNAFATASPAPAYSGNRAPAGAISYIDLSETKITGKVYNRTSGAFAGVPVNTVIYLPAGNTAVGPNFVIGGVCEDMQLDASTEEAFELSKDFTAAKASFDRSFTAGKDAHDNAKCYTVYLPYAVNIAKTGGDFFTCGEYDAATGTINMTNVTAPNLEANTAYIYTPAADGTMSPMTSVKVVKPTAAAANPENALETTGLHGVYEYHQWTSEPGNVYCFAAGDATAVNGKDIKAGQFVKVGSGTHIKPFRAYLRINVPAGGSAPEYVAVDWGNGTTSIVPLDKTQVSQDADGWYTITGFRLPAKPTERGIYIHNNKKTIVK